MKIAVIGAGGMGGSFGALMAEAGLDVTLIDTWAEHVEAINRDGLLVEGALGGRQINVPAIIRSDDTEWADWVITFTDSNATRIAAESAKAIIKPNGAAVTLQNGVGNVETLVEVLGQDRVLGGSSMCSAAVMGAGHVALTHSDVSSIGELDGIESERVKELAGFFERAGLQVKIDPQITVKIWSKFLLNCGINAICAVTGMRTGEVTRVPEVNAFMDRIIDEALAVTQAKGITLVDPDVRKTIKTAAHYRFNKPSMLQHVTVGRRTEIDAINGALIREGQALGISTPYNESLVAMLKGREQKRIRDVHEPDLDYDAWESTIADDALPPTT